MNSPVRHEADNRVPRPGNGYLEAISQPNVTVFTGAGLNRITKTGVLDPDGREHEVDAIICAVSSNLSMPQVYPETNLSDWLRYDLGASVPYHREWH